MLENLIGRIFRSIRDRRRERVAARFEEIAEVQAAKKRLAATTLAAATLSGAPKDTLDLFRVAYRKHKRAEEKARQIAADVRAGRRRRG